MAQMTGFELRLNAIFAASAGIPTYEIAEAIFGRIMSVSTRLDIIIALLEIPGRAFPFDREAARRLLETAQDINTRRNECAHGTYRINERTKEVSLHTWVTSQNRKRKNYGLKTENLDQDIHAVREWLGDDDGCFFKDEFTALGGAALIAVKIAPRGAELSTARRQLRTRKGRTGLSFPARCEPLVYTPTMSVLTLFEGSEKLSQVRIQGLELADGPLNVGA